MVQPLQKGHTMRFRRLSLRLLAVAGLITAAFGVQTALTAGPSAPSTTVTIDPARILDTREPLGVPTKAPVGANSSITLQVTGVGGVPANATGVIVTLTAVNASLPTFITATPTGTPRSTTSVLNPGNAAAIANTVTMALGTGGKIDLYNLAGSVDLIADVSGYLLPAGASSVVTESIELSAYSAALVGPGEAAEFGCISFGGTGVTAALYLDVPLPHGAAVQSVAFRWFDNDGANFQMFLSEIDSGANFSNPSGGNLINNTTASTGAVANYFTSTVTPGGADPVSATARYQIQAITLGKAGSGTFHRFCGATVTYARIIT
jgi:hypothetical protein